MAFDPLSRIAEIKRLTGNENIILTQGDTPTGNGRYPLEQLKKELGNKSLLGSVTPLTQNIEQGVYIASEVGVYPNFGNTEVSQEDFDNGLVLLTKNNDGTFSKDLIPMTVNGEIKDLDNRAVSGEVIFNQHYFNKKNVYPVQYLKTSIFSNLTDQEIECLEVIKSIEVISKEPFFDKLAIETLVGSGGDPKGMFRIKNITTDEVYSLILNTDDLINVKSFVIKQGVNLVVNVDWTGFEGRGIILNRVWSITGNMLLSSAIYNSQLSNTQNDLSNTQNDLSNTQNDFNKAFDYTLVEQNKDTLNGLETELYGASTVKGYAFPIGSVSNLLGVSINGDFRGNKLRIMLLKESNTGEVIHDELFDISPGLIQKVMFSKEINYPGNLYIRVISNAFTRIMRHTPTEVFTGEKGFAVTKFTTEDDAIVTGVVSQGGNAYSDYSIDLIFLGNKLTIKEDVLPNWLKDLDFKEMLRKNLRICCAGSSVTWGTGFLEDSMLQYLIPFIQIGLTDFKGINEVDYNGNISKIQSKNSVLYFGYEAMKLNSENSTIEFEITGDEISICQAIERSNKNASMIGIYVDGVLYDTFSNYNTAPLGFESKQFTSVQGQKEYLLEKPFTYGHILKVNGVDTPVSLSKSSTAPTSGWIIARDLQEVNGSVIVQHTLFNMDGSNDGDIIDISFNYGQELTYAKTTIGKDENGVLENQYGRGYTAFDPANPPASFSFGTGLDFRETDERVIRKYTFTEEKKRNVKIEILGLDPRADIDGVPYFIFNFATSRIVYFQNAGIGGWKSSQFDDPNNSMGNVNRTWREICEFSPDIVFYESTPNDDWGVGGYKVYTEQNNLSLSQLQAIRTLPNKEIKYNAGTDDYNYHRWCGYISAIDKWSVTLSGESIITIDPKEGDTIVLGTYFSDNKQQVVRNVRSYDKDLKKVFFDAVINEYDYKYDSLDYFIGKEIQIRDLRLYINPTESLLSKIKSFSRFPKIYLVDNPAPNMLSRDLASYTAYLKMLGSKENSDKGYRLSDGFVDLSNVYDWQYSLKRDKTLNIDASSLINGELDLTTLPKAINYLNYQIIVDGIDVTNKDAVVYTSYCLGVDRKLSGAALNDTATRGKQVWGNFYPRIKFLKNIPNTGQITINYCTNVWSGDSCHVNANSKRLFALGYLKNIL